MATTDDTNWRPSEGNVSKQSFQRRRPDRRDGQGTPCISSPLLWRKSPHACKGLCPSQTQDRASTPPGETTRHNTWTGYKRGQLFVCTPTGPSAAGFLQAMGEGTPARLRPMWPLRARQMALLAAEASATWPVRFARILRDGWLGRVDIMSGHFRHPGGREVSPDTTVMLIFPPIPMRLRTMALIHARNRVYVVFFKVQMPAVKLRTSAERRWAHC